MGAAEEEEVAVGVEQQLINKSGSSSSSKQHFGSTHLQITKTGTTWTAMAHIITGVIGAGVLSLGWSIAQLGWVGGPLLLVVFAGVTLLSCTLISDCYHVVNRDLAIVFDDDDDDEHHHIVVNRSYMQAVRYFLGTGSGSACLVMVQLSLYGTAIAYTITAGVGLRAIQKSNCYHKEGHQASCFYGDEMYMLLFGCVQIIVSQIPDFHNMEWLSSLAAVMSFTYSTIGLGLGVAKVIGNQAIKGSISGVPASSAFKKMSLAFQALGDIAFAYPYTVLVLEIQDTLKSPPAENKTMKKASMYSVLITTFFYLSCGGFGYAAFGDETPGNILTGFGFYGPYWLIDFANACIVVHLVGGYQVYSQPVFAIVEEQLSRKFPTSGFVKDFHIVKLPPPLPKVQLNLMRLLVRTAYVFSTTGIAMLFPYFNEVLGVLGAFSFWPLTIYFPVEMYCVQKGIQAWTTKGVLLRTFSAICFLFSIIALAGSVEGLVSAKFS